MLGVGDLVWGTRQKARAQQAFKTDFCGHVENLDNYGF